MTADAHLKHVPPGWERFIKDGGHGNLMDQRKLEEMPEVRRWNQRLIDYGFSTPGSEVCFLMDNSSGYRCLRPFQRQPKDGDPCFLVALQVPPECDPPLARAEGLELRPLRWEDFHEWNKRHETEADVKKEVQRDLDFRAAEERRLHDKAADLTAGQLEDLAIHMEENPGQYAPRTTTGFSRAAELAAATKEPEPEAVGEEEAKDLSAPEDEPEGEAPAEDPAPAPSLEERVEALTEKIGAKAAAEALGVSTTTLRKYRDAERGGVPESRREDVAAELDKAEAKAAGE